MEITDLKNKRNNTPTAEGKVTAEEWNFLIDHVLNPVKSVSFNGGVRSFPDLDGNADIIVNNDQSYSMDFELKQYNKTYVVSEATEEFFVNYTYTPTRTKDGVKRNLDFDGQMTISAQYNGGRLTKVETINVAHGESGLVDVMKYLKQGQNTLYFLVKYNVIDIEGKVTQVVTSEIYTITITYTSLTATIADDITKPWLAESNQLPVHIVLTGSVQRVLNVQVVGSSGTYKLAVDIAADKYNSAAAGLYTYNIPVSGNDTYGLLTHGVKTISVWLSCNDGNGGTINGPVHTVQRMHVADAKNNTPYIVLSDIVQKVNNYEYTRLFNYAVYSISNNEVDVSFEITNRPKSGSSSNKVTYFQTLATVIPNSIHEVSTAIQIENTKDDEITVFLNGTAGSTSMSERQVIVDNSRKISTVPGADLYVNPSTRTNDGNAKKIKNAAKNTWLDTISTTGFAAGENDLWTVDSDGVNVLRVLAGQEFSFKYDWLDVFTGPTGDVTLELDFKVDNITDESYPIFDLSEAYKNGFIGFKMFPLQGFVCTKSKQDKDYLDFRIQEGVRTHIAINIVSNAFVTDTAKLSLCRVFVNGIINREFIFDTANNDWVESGKVFKIGSKDTKADVDIYSIRCYKTTPILTAKDIVTNYTTSLRDAEQMSKFRSENSIMDETGLITLKASLAVKKNCLVWHGLQPSKEVAEPGRGWYEIFVYKDNGDLDLDHSGTICKDTLSLKPKSQGTTARTYYWHNIQTKLERSDKTIEVDLNLIINNSSKTGITVADRSSTKIKLYGCGLGKNDWATNEAIRIGGALEYDITAAGNVVVPDGWIDGNDIYRGCCYSLTDDSGYGVKLVNKINYASSMLSHLMGANNAYNDLHTAIVREGETPIGILRDNSNARICKKELPFLYFVENADTNGNVTFQGPCTFGPGKMDNAQFGYDKKQYPNFCMLEGSDNNLLLADFRVPFDESKITYLDIEIGKESDATPETDDNGVKYYEAVGIEYDGELSLDFDKFLPSKVYKTARSGNNVQVPTNEIIDYIKLFVNFVYLHSPLIKVFDGTYTEFLGSANASNQTDQMYKWWCYEDDQAYLYRYDSKNREWIHAGLTDSYGNPLQINLRTDSITAQAFIDHQGDPDATNRDIISRIAADARRTGDSIMDLNSLRFHYCFVNSLLAGTDNCSKNTYYILVPYGSSGKYRWAFAQDDMDTIFATDNSGFQSKPYYVDRQHPVSEEGVDTYNGTYNALFCLEEAMFENSGQNRLMMSTILGTMRTLGGGSVWDFFDKYFFSTQKYFPAVAYNEAARIRYEYPMTTSQPTGRGNVEAIAQSLGDQLQAEQEFMKKRLVLFASYARFGDFAGEPGLIGIDDAKASLDLQGNGSGTHYLKLTVVPHQYMYPGARVGLNGLYKDIRMKPGESYELDFTQGRSIWMSETVAYLFGSNYYRSLGELGDIDVSGNFTLKAKRLTSLLITKDKFKSGGLNLDLSPNLETINLNGATNVTNQLDLSKQIKLKSVDIRNSNVTTLYTPQSYRLETVRLSDGCTNIQLKNLPAFTTLSGSYAAVRTIEIEKTPGITSWRLPSIIHNLYSANKNSDDKFNISIKGISLSPSSTYPSNSITADSAIWLARKGAALTGNLTVRNYFEGNRDRYFTTEEVIKLIDTWGHLSKNNTSTGIRLYYGTLPIAIASVSGDIYLSKKSTTYPYSIITTPVYGSDVAIKDDGTPDITYTLDSAASSYGEVRGRGIYVKNLDASRTKYKFTVTINKTDGTKVTGEFKVVFNTYIPKVGDFLFHTGLLDSESHLGMQYVGTVFAVENNSGKYKAHCVAIDQVDLADVEKLSDKYKDTSKHKQLFYSAVDIESNSGSGLNTVVQGLSSQLGGTNLADISDNTNYEYSDINTGAVSKIVDSSKSDGYSIQLGNIFSNLDGKTETENTMSVAKTATLAALNKAMPTTLTGYLDAINEAQSGRDERYSEFYYPIVATKFYEPAVADGLSLSDSLKTGNWHTPSYGEGVRIAHYHTLGTEVDQADKEQTKDALKPIFANANKDCAINASPFKVSTLNPTITEAKAGDDAYVKYINASPDGVTVSRKGTYIRYITPCITIDVN